MVLDKTLGELLHIIGSIYDRTYNLVGLGMLSLVSMGYASCLMMMVQLNTKATLGEALTGRKLLGMSFKGLS